MQKKQINPIFLDRLPRVTEYLTSKETIKLMQINKDATKALAKALTEKKRQYIDLQFANLSKQSKKKIFKIDNFFRSESLDKLAQASEFSEITKKSIHEEARLLEKKVNPELRNLDQNKIFKFGSDFYLVIKKSLLAQTMNSKLLSKKQTLEAIPEKAKFDQVIKEVSKEFEDSGSILDRNMLLERHKRLQNRLKSEATLKASQQKNAFRTELIKLFGIKRLGLLLSTYGDFCLSVFDVKKGKEVFHTSDHKYVIRKKNGTKQSKKDKSKKIRSVGSNIRRANERKHLENIERIFVKHLGDVQSCDLILVTAPGDNLIELKAILEKFDLSSVCFRNLGQTVGKAKYSKLVQIRTDLLKAVVITF